MEKQKFEIITENSRSYLNLVLKQNSSKPVRIQSINLYGAEQFREPFLKRQLEPLLKGEKLTVEEFLSQIDKVKDNFLKTQAITNIGVQIDNSFFKTKSPRNGVELITNVEIIPVKKYFLKLGTNVGNGEGDGYLTLLYKNIFGGSESLTFDTTILSNSLSAKNKSTYLLNFSSPIRNSPNWRSENIAFQTTRLIDYMCHHEQVIKGFDNKIVSQNELWNHEFTIENVLRTINVMRGNNQFSMNDDILFQSGDSLKSSINYTLKYDSRDDPVLPTSGLLFKSSSEYSILSPFIKSQIELQMGQKATNSNIFNISLKAGYVQSLVDQRLHIMDRFYFGGPNDLRGYELNGLGPKMMNSPVGGNLFFGVNLSNFQNMGKYESFKVHTFVNCGNVLNLNHVRQLPNLIREPSVSTGIGLVYKHPIARLELNFVMPVVSHHYDSTRKGFQYGIGLSFM